jgi:hypothetical protein
MKKYIFLVLLFFILAFQAVNAQEVTPSLSPTPTPVQYTLPYPGLLPGHPLYFLKNTRDTIVGFFISSPLKKAEYDLLQADKNVHAAVFLLREKKNSRLVMATLAKAEIYFRDAISKTKDAEKQGMVTRDMAAKLVLANAKYQETLLQMIQVAEGETKNQLTVELDKIKKIGEEGRKLQRK